MNVLVISNMGPSKAHPGYGIFVQNQVDEIRRGGQVENLRFLSIQSKKKGIKAVLLKYARLAFDVITKAVFCRQTFAIVHVHYFYPTIWFALIYKMLRNPRAKIVVTFHGSDIYNHEPPGRLYKFTHRFISHCVFVSEGLKQRYFANDKPSTVLSAGILNVFEPRPSDKQYDLVMVGGMEKLKGLDRLLDLLEHQSLGLKVAVIGEGSYADKIQAFTSETHKVDYLGNCDPEHICEVINQSRFLLSLSRFESFGLVMTEAMACGVPVIATSTDGARAQLIEQFNGFLIDNNAQPLANLVANTVQTALDLDCEQYNELSKNALDCVEQHRLSQVIVGLVKVYRKLTPK